jgi:hypothetical protein
MPQKKPLPEGAVKQTLRRRQARKRACACDLANETKRLIADTDTSNGRYRKRALNSTPTLGMTRHHTPRRALSFRRSLLN